MEGNNALGLPYLFKIVLMAREYFDASLLGGKGSDVPDAQSIVHGIAQQIGTIWRQTQTRHCVCMTS